ncbi:hypothetical protein, partial [Pseudomonas aeruginosa]
VGYLATAEHPKHGQPHKAFNSFKDQHDAQVAHWRERGCTVTEDRLMTVAQHDRIVGALRDELEAERKRVNIYVNNNRIRQDNERLRAELRAALARVEELERKLRDEENAHTTTIEQRDNAEHWADQLAKAIAERFGVDIGEHSNLNCPWNEALVWMQQPPTQAQHSVPGDIMRDAQRYRWLRDQQFYFSFSTENSDAGISSCTAGMSSRFK